MPLGAYASICPATVPATYAGRPGLNPDVVMSRGGDAAPNARADDVYRRAAPEGVLTHMKAKRLPALSAPRLSTYVAVSPVPGRSDPTTVGAPPCTRMRVHPACCECESSNSPSRYTAAGLAGSCAALKDVRRSDERPKSVLVNRWAVRVVAGSGLDALTR